MGRPGDKVSSQSDRPALRSGRVARLLAQVRPALGVYRGLPRSLRLVVAATPGRAAALLVINLVYSLSAPANALASKFLVEALVANRPNMALLVVVVFTLIHLVSNGAGYVQEVVVWGQIDRLRYYLHTRIMTQATAMFDLALFESPSFYNKLENARQGMPWTQRLFMQTIHMCSQFVIFLSFLGVLSLLHPLAAVVVLLSTVPTYIAKLRYGFGAWSVYRSQAPGVRRLDYYYQLLTTEPAAKEVRLFDLGGHFIARYRRIFGGMLSEIEAFRRRHGRVQVPLSAITSLCIGGVLFYAVWQAIQGAVGIGDVVLYFSAIFFLHGTASNMLQTAGTLYTAQLHVSNILEFLDLESPMRPAADGRKVPAPWQEGLELRNVTFRYPGTEQPVLRQVSLRIRPGETVALVGHNGAGKTTLVKLLCRLYDPTAGRILLDGHDLREYDLRDVRRHTTVIFQDYARYHFTAGENIGLAAVSRRDDGEAIAAAAAQSGADEVIERLPHGYDTQLGREFEDGMELSIGEWQKVALARAFFREAQFQILDEPTAALDAQAEYDVYLRFRELTQGRTTLLISHRFSTVRMADRILVLDRGRLVEEGSHDTLMARGGLYADLYEKQASRYR